MSIIQRLKASSLFTDTAKLVSGTAGGRLILLAVLPVVTRLYDPEDFALLAVYMALITTLSVAACLRLDIAIPLAETDEQAADLLVMSLIIAGVLSIFAFLASMFAAHEIAAFIGTPAIAPYLWLVGLGVMLAACYSALQFWATRAHRFGSIAKTRIGQAGIGAGAMVGFGWLGFAPLGLLIGNMLTVGAGAIRLAYEAVIRDGDKFKQVTKARLLSTLARYRRYPLFSTPEALANVAGVQIPILIIAAFSGPEAGQLFLAMQLMAVPMMLLGASIGQVYVSRAPDALREGRLAKFTHDMMRRLFLIGIGPIVLAAMLSPWLFPLIFGKDWARAGIIVCWLAPWMLLQLVVSPVSLALHVTNKQALAMILQFFGLVLRSGAVIWASFFWQHGLVLAFSVSSGLFYLLYSGVVLYAVRLK